MLEPTYYASLDTDTETAARKINDIISNARRRICGTQGIAQVWSRNLEIYFRNAYCDALSSAGVKGELVSMSVPQARSLARQTIAIVCKQKLHVKALMESTDYASNIAGTIAEAIANQIIKDKSLDAKLDQSAEHAYVYGQTFWFMEWDSEANDIKVSVVPPENVFYDWGFSSWQDVNWFAVLVKANRYDMMAQHPELADVILKLPKYSPNYGERLTDWPFQTEYTDLSEDTIAVYQYYHKPTPAAPAGRMMIMSTPDCVYYDGSNPYECLPGVLVIPERLGNLLLGYPQFSNLTATQEMMDHNFSVVASNQTAFGVQSILNPRTSNISVDMSGPLRWIDYTPQNIDGGGKPEALQLTRTAPELINMIEVYNNHMGQLANINGALRGAPPAGVTAASALATLTANSIEFLTPLSKSLFFGVEEVLTMCVKFFRMFGAEKQIVQIADGNLVYAKEFKSEDLNAFKRITLDLVNPTMATYAGRLNDAQILMDRGLIKDIGTYYRVKEGAPVRTMYQTELEEANLIQKENDDLTQGIQCPVLFFDNHQAHIDQHKAPLYDPTARRQGASLQVILEHIQQHQQMMAQAQGGGMPQGAGGMPPDSQGSGNPVNSSIPPNNNPQPAAPASPAKPPISF